MKTNSTLLLIIVSISLFIIAACDKDEETDPTPIVYYQNTNDTLDNNPNDTLNDLTSETFTDARDGKIYNWVQIGEQIWMSENLAYLPSVNRVADGSEDATGSYYYVYGYDGTNVTEAKATLNYQTYGVLYNWTAAYDGESSSSTNPSNIQGVCPVGWHLPSDAEWKELQMAIGMSQTEADKDDLWRGTNEGSKLADNANLWNDGGLELDFDFGTSGFNALPGGRRDYGDTFYGIGYLAHWWTATEFGATISGWVHSLSNTATTVSRGECGNQLGFSVRCVKD